MAFVSDQGDRRGGPLGALPPLAGEDFVCTRCGVSFAEVPVEQALESVARVPGEVREVVSGVAPQIYRVRPDTQCWSITEYVCHLRDVYATYTIRLHRAITESEPMLEPMFNDLRAQRFRYNQLDVHAVLPELIANAAGFSEEANQIRDNHWGRIVTRLPGEARTARWLARQVMHEGMHHLDDIRRTIAAVSKMM